MNRTKPLFDLNGNHLQMHGEPELHSSLSASRLLGILPGLQVMTRTDGKNRKATEVVLFAADKPFTFDWRMTAPAARVLAANLLQACDMADQVAAAQTTQRKAAKARKGGK